MSRRVVNFENMKNAYEKYARDPEAQKYEKFLVKLQYRFDDMWEAWNLMTFDEMDEIGWENHPARVSERIEKEVGINY